MNIKEDLKKRILSKIEEGYNEGGRLVEMGEVALYPEPAPAVDPTVQGSGKALQVDSDLLRDLLNWATSADAGSIDAVVAKAEEMGMSSPLTPAQLVDLTATAHTADPSNPTVAAVPGCASDTTPGVTSPVVPAGPVGPLSPVMASFMRRGKAIREGEYRQEWNGTVSNEINGYKETQMDGMLIVTSPDGEVVGKGSFADGWGDGPVFYDMVKDGKVTPTKAKSFEEFVDMLSGGMEIAANGPSYDSQQQMPIMASIMRRGKKVQELASLPKMDAAGAIQVKTVKKPGSPAPIAPKHVAQLARAEKKFQARAAETGENPGEMTLYGNEADEHGEEGGEPEVDTRPEDMHDHGDDQKNRHLDDEEREDMFDSENDNTGARIKALKAEIARLEAKTKEITGGHAARMGAMGIKNMKEDDIIDSDHEVITAPEQMGKKNPKIQADGGQKLPATTRPIGKLNDPANMGGEGLAEDGIEDEVGEIENGVEDAAVAIAGGIADGIAGDGIETEPEGEVEIGGEMAPLSPEVMVSDIPSEGGEGLVGQIASLQTRVAELEALLGGTVGAESPEGELEIGGEEGEEDELSIDGNVEDEEGEESEDDDAEDGEESEDDDTEEKEDDEAGEEDEEGEDEEGKKLLLGDEEEEKVEERDDPYTRADQEEDERMEMWRQDNEDRKRDEKREKEKKKDGDKK